MVWLGRDLEADPISPLAMSRDLPLNHDTPSPVQPGLNTARDGTATTSGNSQYFPLV